MFPQPNSPSLAFLIEKANSNSSFTIYLHSRAILFFVMLMPKNKWEKSACENRSSKITHVNKTIFCN